MKGGREWRWPEEEGAPYVANGFPTGRKPHEARTEGPSETARTMIETQSAVLNRMLVREPWASQPVSQLVRLLLPTCHKAAGVVEIPGRTVSYELRAEFKRGHWLGQPGAGHLKRGTCVTCSVQCPTRTSAAG